MLTGKRMQLSSTLNSRSCEYLCRCNISVLINCKNFKLFFTLSLCVEFDVKNELNPISNKVVT